MSLEGGRPLLILRTRDFRNSRAVSRMATFAKAYSAFDIMMPGASIANYPAVGTALSNLGGGTIYLTSTHGAFTLNAGCMKLISWAYSKRSSATARAT